jgi:hypothetical protein
VSNERCDSTLVLQLALLLILISRRDIRSPGQISLGIDRTREFSPHASSYMIYACSGQVVTY